MGVGMSQRATKMIAELDKYIFSSRMYPLPAEYYLMQGCPGWLAYPWVPPELWHT